MKRSLKSFLWLALPAMLAASCEEPLIKDKPLKKFDWLQGEWFGTTPDVAMQENWQKVNDDLFTAHAFVLAGTDTVFQEHVKLRNINDTIHYIVFIAGIPDSTSFILKKYENDEAVFENPENDFPQQIVYKKVGNDSLHAYIAGQAGGEVRREEFRYKLIAAPPKDKEENKQ